MCKVFIEVGSLNTKINLIHENGIQNLANLEISFKNHYLEDHKLRQSDIDVLVDAIKKLKLCYDNIIICGTSIFRDLPKIQSKNFLDLFEIETGYKFIIVSQQQEAILTALGACDCVKRACVYIGGGGSTEIAIVESDTIKIVKSVFGVIDILERYPMIADDIPTLSLKQLKKIIKKELNIPKIKTDILVLAGGAHEDLIRRSRFSYMKNTIYRSVQAPILLKQNVLQKEIFYYYNVSLRKMKDIYGNSDWWDTTKATYAIISLLIDELDVKYIIPTNVSMVYGYSKYPNLLTN